MAQLAAGPVTLVLEAPERFGIVVNDRPIDGRQDEGGWVDPAFRRLDITGAVKAGRNEVRLTCVVTRATELESIYITGRFIVAASGCAAKPAWRGRSSTGMRMRSGFFRRRRSSLLATQAGRPGST